MVAASPDKAKEPSRVPSQDAERTSRRKFSWPLLLLEVAIALASGLLSGSVVAAWTVSEQARIDDLRSEREAQREDARSEREARQENLRFVRDRSSTEIRDRPFQDIDLAGQNLSGLKLEGADFSGGSLANARLGGADLSRSKLSSTNLSGADLGLVNLQNADLFGANLQGARLVLANLRGANLSSANLEGVIFVEKRRRETTCFDDSTVWPDGFTPPSKPGYSLCDFQFPVEQSGVEQ